MSISPKFAILWVSAHLAFAGAAETATTGAATAESERACAGVNNEGIKRRELMRELGPYIGETVPEELQKRVTRHFELVLKLKAECERARSSTEASR